MKLLLAHWDKIVLGAVIVIAALIMAAALAGGGAREQFNTAAPAKQVAAASNEVDYSALLARASAPTLDALSPDPLARPDLQRCTGCKKIQPRWVVKCPECGVTVTYSEDSDGDGMPNEWERKYGLSWTSAADASQDLDGDGLTNLEEYKRGSDPTDPADPNLIKDEYRLAGVYRPVRPVMFVHFNKTAAGTTLQVRYKGSTRFMKPGDELKDGAKPVYKIGDLKEKMELVWVPAINASQRQDRSELTMTDLASKETFVMVKGMTNYEAQVEAKLLNLASGAEVIAREGDTIELAKALHLPAAQRQATVVALDAEKRNGIFAVGAIKYTVPVD